MAFVLPAGDYEAALRMAGASNFMEALESGIDRQARRRAQREAFRQSRDLYNRQAMLESANLLGEEFAGAYGGAAGGGRGGRGGGGAAGIPRMGATQAILSDMDAYQRSLDEEAAVQAQIEEALAASAVAEEPVMELESNVFMRPEGGVYAEGERWAFDPSLASPYATSPVYPLPGEPTVEDMSEAGPVTRISDLGRDLLAARGATEIAPRIEVPYDPWTRQPQAPAADPNLAAAVDQAVAAREEEQASRQEFPTKTRGEPVFLSGDQEKLAAINARERRGKDTLDDRIERRAIYQRQRGLPEGESWIDPEAAKAGQLNELISAATRGTPLPSWATADDLADAADLAKGMFASTEVSDVLSREAMLRAKGSPPLEARPIGGGGVSTSGALGVDLLAQAIGQLDERGLPATEGGIQESVRQTLEASGMAPSPGVVSGRHAEVGARIAEKVPDDQLGEAIRALSTGKVGRELREGAKISGVPSPLLRQLDRLMPGLAYGPTEFRGDYFGGALEELERRQERADLAGPEVEVVEEPVQIGTYTVKKGDYLHKISSSYGVKLKALVEANRDLLYPGGVARSVTSGGGKVLSGQDLIYPGEELRIPTGDGRETGGEAGPVDSREGAEKGILAKAEGESDTLKELRAKLLKIQEGRPDKPVNPFQKFGRDITFLPSLRAVAFAVGRAEQGDFSMINQMAGRVVKNYELEGLFADYRDFATGARRRADEIYMDQALEQQTKEQEKKLAAINATEMMALTQFVEAGYEGENAKIFAGFYANLYAEDPEQARAWSTTLNAMGKDRRAAEAKRLKYGSGVGGTGRGGRQYSDKEIGRVEARLDKAQGRLTTAISGLSRALAPNGVPLPIEEMRKRAEEDPSIAPHVENYERALNTYNRHERQLEMMNEANLPPEALDAYQVESGKIDYAHVAKAYFGDGTSWDEFEQKLTEDGFSQAAAAQLRAFFEAKDKDFYDQISVIGGEPPEEAPGPVTREDLEAELARPGLTGERRAEVDRLLGDLGDDFAPTVSPMEASGAAPALLLNYTKADDAAQLLLYRAQKGEDITKSELRKAKGDLASVQVAMERLEKSKAWKKNPVWRSPGRQTRIIGHVLGGVRPAGMRPLGRVGEGSLRSDISNIETTLWQLDKISGR